MVSIAISDFVIARLWLCALRSSASPQKCSTRAGGPAAGLLDRGTSNEFWTIPDRNQINEGMVTLLPRRLAVRPLFLAPIWRECYYSARVIFSPLNIKGSFDYATDDARAIQKMIDSEADAYIISNHKVF